MLISTPSIADQIQFRFASLKLEETLEQTFIEEKPMTHVTRRYV